MKKAILLLAVLFLGALAFAQNAPLPTSTVTTTFEAASLPSIGKTLPATIMDAGLSFSPSTTVSAETLQAPGVISYYGGAFAYQVNGLSTLLNNATSGSGFKFRFTVLGSLGGVISAEGKHLGGNARFRTEYAMGSGVWNLGAEIGAIRLPGVTRGFAPLVSVGPTINF